MEFGAAVYCQLWVDGVSGYNSSASWFPDLAHTAQPGVSAITWTSGGVQGVAMYTSSTYNAAPTPAHAAFASEADVAVGALDLESIPDRDGSDAWSVLKEIAAAELGMVGFSESGRFFFKTRSMLSAAVSPVATWDVDLVDDVHPAITLDSVLTRVTGSVKPVTGVQGSATNAIVADKIVTVPPGVSSVILSGSHPVLSLGQKVGDLGSMNVSTYPAAMALCTAPNGLNLYTGGQVTAYVTPVGVASWKFTFTNPTGSTFYTVWPASASSATFSTGDPALWIRGVDYSQEWPAAISRVGDQTWGDRTYELPESVWRQSADAVAAFADALLVDAASPRATLSDVTVPADPRWQLGDPVRLTDWRGRLPGIVARITSIRLYLDREKENGMVGTYGLRQIVGAPPTIDVQPADTVAAVGGKATFSVAASGATSYSWQMDQGQGWVPAAGTGVLSAAFTTYPLTVEDNGTRFRCRVIGPAGDDWTRAARLSMPAATAPAVTLSPSNADVLDGYTVTFTAAASGAPAPTVQWQVSTDGTTWVNVSGATSTSLSFVARVSDYGKRYRAVFTNSAGTATTSAAVLTVSYD